MAYVNQPEDKFLVTNFEFEENFDMSLEGDCHEVEVKDLREMDFNPLSSTIRDTNSFIIFVIQHMKFCFYLTFCVTSRHVFVTIRD